MAVPVKKFNWDSKPYHSVIEHPTNSAALPLVLGATSRTAFTATGH